MSLYLYLFLVGFLLVHFCKMLRLYLVLMEHKIPFDKFVLLYAKTTLVNLLIPYKIGEIYRFYCISKETKHWQVGILSIVVDRFFDTLALCLILIPLDVYLCGTQNGAAANFVLSNITWIFIVLLCLIVLCYISILPTYRYLNRYIIREKKSTRSMAALKGLDVVKNWYDFTAQLIRGRALLIFIASLFGWGFEILTLKSLAYRQALPFGVVDFSKYIQSVFLGGGNQLERTYVCCGAYAMLMLTVVGYIIYAITSYRKLKERVK